MYTVQPPHPHQMFFEIESNESNMKLASVPMPAPNDGEAPQLVPSQNDDEENGEALQPDRGPQLQL